MRTVCTYESCEKVAHARGLCKKHYERERRAEHGGGCTVEACDRSHYGHGFCSMHYFRWRKHGDPLVVVVPDHSRPPSDLAERFWAKVDVRGPDECWPWTGAVGPGGYGNFATDGRRGEEAYANAHRVAYELLVGPIPEGLVLDHVWERGCRHRHCVNPAHLEPVTQAENVRRSRRWAARAAS